MRQNRQIQMIRRTLATASRRCDPPGSNHGGGTGGPRRPRPASTSTSPHAGGGITAEAEPLAGIAAGQAEQIRCHELDIRAIAVVPRLIRRDRQRPCALMPARRFAVIRLGRSVLMTASQAQHRHAAAGAHEGVQRDHRGQQNGMRSAGHIRRCYRHSHASV